MFIELMSEDLTFIVKIEQYLLRSRRERLPKTRLYFILHACKLWRGDKRTNLQLMQL